MNRTSGDNCSRFRTLSSKTFPVLHRTSDAVLCVENDQRGLKREVQTFSPLHTWPITEVGVLVRLSLSESSTSRDHPISGNIPGKLRRALCLILMLFKNSAINSALPQNRDIVFFIGIAHNATRPQRVNKVYLV